MHVKEMCLIAVMAAIQQVVFTSFSYILYVECITFTILVFAMCFTKKQAVMASFVFTLLNLAIQGINLYTMLYVCVYPLYSFCIASMKPYLKKHKWLLVLCCGFFSFLTGQLLQLPFMLVSSKVTLVYIMLGLKTSLIQGGLSAILCSFCYTPVCHVLEMIERRMRNA